MAESDLHVTLSLSLYLWKIYMLIEQHKILIIIILIVIKYLMSVLYRDIAPELYVQNSQFALILRPNYNIYNMIKLFTLDKFAKRGYALYNFKVKRI